MKKIQLPACHFYKMKDSGQKAIIDSLAASIKLIDKISDENLEYEEYLTVLLKKKDDSGKYFFSIGTMPLNSLKNKDKISFSDISSSGIKTITINK